jgi:hypothetical protein
MSTRASQAWMQGIGGMDAKTCIPACLPACLASRLQLTPWRRMQHTHTHTHTHTQKHTHNGGAGHRRRDTRATHGTPRPPSSVHPLPPLCGALPPPRPLCEQLQLPARLSCASPPPSATPTQYVSNSVFCPMPHTPRPKPGNAPNGAKATRRSRSGACRRWQHTCKALACR